MKDLTSEDLLSPQTGHTETEEAGSLGWMDGGTDGLWGHQLGPHKSPHMNSASVSVCVRSLQVTLSLRVKRDVWTCVSGGALLLLWIQVTLSPDPT